MCISSGCSGVVVLVMDRDSIDELYIVSICLMCALIPTLHAAKRTSFP